MRVPYGLEPVTVAALFIGTVAVQVALYHGLESPLLLSLHLVPVLLCAAFWGLWGGVAAGLASTVAVGALVGHLTSS